METLSSTDVFSATMRLFSLSLFPWIELFSNIYSKVTPGRAGLQCFSSEGV